MAGERYDGEWLEGQENGVGVFTWRDGSTYEGFWEGGKKTGVGVFRPTPRAPGALPDSEASARLAARAAAEERGGASPRSPMGSPTAADAPLDSPAAAAATRHRLDLLAPGGRGGRCRRGRAGNAAPRPCSTSSHLARKPAGFFSFRFLLCRVVGA